MNKKVLLSSLVGAVAAFFLGWLIYGMLLESFMRQHTAQYAGLMKMIPGEMPPIDSLFTMFISNLASSWMIAYIFSRSSGVSDFMSGMKYAAAIGAGIAVSIDLLFYSMMNFMDSTGYVVDIIASTIMTGILGGVIALVQSKVSDS